MGLPNPNYELPRPIEALALEQRKGYSPMVVYVGDQTGIGKTRMMVRVSELVLWRNFRQLWKPTGNLFYSLTSFKDELFDSEGKILDIDESEIELGADSWQSMENRWFSRMKDTQRVKGNIYQLALPMLMALARKHRRRINYIFDVKGRGYAKVYKLKKHSANLLGDELSKFWIGDVQVKLPECEFELDLMDKENKKRILNEQNKIFDDEIKLQKMQKEAKMKKIEKILNGDRPSTDKIFKYKYKCFHCGFIIKSNELLDKIVKCENCNQKVYMHEQFRVE